MIWVGTFYVCFSTNYGSAGGFPLLQYSSGLFDDPVIFKCLNVVSVESSCLLYYRLVQIIFLFLLGSLDPLLYLWKWSYARVYARGVSSVANSITAYEES